MEVEHSFTDLFRGLMFVLIIAGFISILFAASYNIGHSLNPVKEFNIYGDIITLTFVICFWILAHRIEKKVNKSYLNTLLTLTIIGASSFTGYILAELIIIL
jgi:hypothetical protein